jgi:hypothetical protein
MYFDYPSLIKGGHNFAVIRGARRNDAHVYDWEYHDTGDFNRAFSLAREWDYNSDAPVGLGVLYKTLAPTFGDRYPVRPPRVPMKVRP